MCVCPSVCESSSEHGTWPGTLLRFHNRSVFHAVHFLYVCPYQFYDFLCPTPLHSPASFDGPPWPAASQRRAISLPPIFGTVLSLRQVNWYLWLRHVFLKHFYVLLAVERRESNGENKWISSLKSDESSWWDCLRGITISIWIPCSASFFLFDLNSLFFFLFSFLLVSCPQLEVMCSHVSRHEEALLGSVFETWKHLRGCRKKS